MYDQNNAAFSVSAGAGARPFAEADGVAYFRAAGPMDASIDAPLLTHLMAKADQLAALLAQTRDMAGGTRGRVIGIWPTSDQANGVKTPGDSNQAQALRHRMDTLLNLAADLAAHVQAIDQGL